MFDQLSWSRSFARKTFVSCFPGSSRILLILAHGKESLKRNFSLLETLWLLLELCSNYFHLAFMITNLLRVTLFTKTWGAIHSTKFPEISVHNSMDPFGPTGKVSKKLVHLLRWSSFPGRTGLNFGWMDRVPCFTFRDRRARVWREKARVMFWPVQSNLSNTDTEGTEGSVRIRKVPRIKEVTMMTSLLNNNNNTLFHPIIYKK